MITYSHEKYIEEAINGVLIQKFGGDIELIIANDNSPDHTDEIIQQILKNSSIPENIQIKYTKHPKNIGMMPNFIWALKEAKGKYVAICEGDDYWIDPQKLQKQVDFLEENLNIDLVTSNSDIIYFPEKIYKKKIIGSEQFPISKDIGSFLWKRGYMAPCTWLSRRNFFLKCIQEKKDLNDATYLIYAIALTKGKTFFIDESTAVYRHLEESASHSKNLLKLVDREIGLFDIEVFLINNYLTDDNKTSLLQDLKKRHFIILSIYIQQAVDLKAKILKKIFRDYYKSSDIINSVDKKAFQRDIYNTLKGEKISLKNKLLFISIIGFNRFCRKSTVNFLFS